LLGGLLGGWLGSFPGGLLGGLGGWPEGLAVALKAAPSWMDFSRSVRIRRRVGV
jgi:hypothetical protein